MIVQDRRFHLTSVIDKLKAIAEPSRLRILSLLSRGDLTVSDLILILGQSQPRVSRHLKLLHEVGLISRYQEGSWVYFHLSDEAIGNETIRMMIVQLDGTDPILERDLERLSTVKATRQEKAMAYFSANADRWNHLRSLHVCENAVESALQRIIGSKRFQSMLDIGTGTGRLLELFSPLYVRGVGIDINRDMLTVARAHLDQACIAHVQIRQGDAYALPVERETFDFVTIHQVLHFLDDPWVAIREAARALRPGGRLLIVDFAPHTLEYLRESHAHVRLGFSDEVMCSWFMKAELTPDTAYTLEPENDDSGLTVKIWLAHDPRALIVDSNSTFKNVTESIS